MRSPPARGARYEMKCHKPNRTLKTKQTLNSVTPIPEVNLVKSISHLRVSKYRPVGGQLLSTVCPSLMLVSCLQPVVFRHGKKLFDLDLFASDEPGRVFEIDEGVDNPRLLLSGCAIADVHAH